MRTIEQIVDFRRVSPDQLFETYVDASLHAAAIGAPVEMDASVGGKFSAFGGVTGRNLLIESPRIIVQAWRAQIFHAEDPDSVLVLTFEKTAEGSRVRLVQVNVPDHAAQTIDRGWRQHYWSRWTEYLTGDRRSSTTAPAWERVWSEQLRRIKRDAETARGSTWR